MLIWRATRVVNFAAGGMAMISAFVAFSVIDNGGGYWLAFLVALASGLVGGAVVERILIRPVESKPPLNAVIVTFGLLIFLEAVAGMIWGENSRALPSHFSIRGLHVGGQTIALSPFDVFVITSVLVVMVLLALLFRATNLGLRMRTAAYQPEVARLLGVRVGRMLSLGWALASLVGALAGVLVAPKVFLSPEHDGRTPRVRLHRGRDRRARQPGRGRRRRARARPRDELRRRLVRRWARASR